MTNILREEKHLSNKWSKLPSGKASTGNEGCPKGSGAAVDIAWP
jgi:hypothetical protein